MAEEDKLEQRKAKLFGKLKSIFGEEEAEQNTANLDIKNKVLTILNKNWIYYLLFLPVLWLAWFIRTRNLSLFQGKYLAGELDCYYFFRLAEYLLEHGKLFAIDMMRYSPLGLKVDPQSSFFVHELVYAYKYFFKFFGLSQMEWHIIYPVVATVISFVFFFLFVRELFDNKIALLATAFLAVIPAYMQRTSAGFADHEALGMVWMFASLWLFAVAWKANKIKVTVPAGMLSGLFAGFMTLTWGGSLFLTLSIGLFAILALLFTNIKKRHFLLLSSWLVGYIPISFYKLGWSGLLTSLKGYDILLLCFAVAAYFIYFVLQKFNIKTAEKFIPKQALALALTGIIGLILVLSTGFLNISSIAQGILHPTGYNRLAFTVSENIQPYFLGGNGVFSDFGWTFVLFLIGSTLLVYTLFNAKKKYGLLASGTFTTALLVFFLGRLSPDAKYANFTNFFDATYLYFFAAFGLAVAFVYFYNYVKDKKIFEEITNNRWQLLLLFVWVALASIIARGAARTIFGLVPPVALASAFFIVNFGNICWKKNIRWLVLILAVFALICFATNANDFYKSNHYAGPSLPGQWEDAMTWIRDNTSQDAVIVHWWDYGYWTQAIGERATVGDGGNAMGWDHQIGRYGLLGRDLNETFAYYKTHKATHLLISGEELGKFHAFATIGSDENFDLRSTIGNFGLASQKEVRNGTRLIYQGGWPLDKDYVIGNLILPEGQAYIIGFSYLLSQENVIQEPELYIYYNEQQIAYPLSCIAIQGKRLEFENGTFPGCFILVPYVSSQQQVNQIGGAYYVSEKVQTTLLVRLYLLGEKIDGFKEVYSSKTPLGLYQGSPIGPIKIWEIEIPDYIQADEKYLEQSNYG